MMDNTTINIQQQSCIGAYSNMVNIFKNIIENMKGEIRKTNNGSMITINNVSETLVQLQNMINNTLCNLGYEVNISMSALNESVNRNNKVRLSESQLHRVIKESVKKILKEWNDDNYPWGAANDPRAPYNQVDDTDYSEESVDAILNFYNKETDDVKEIEISVDVEVEGWRIYDDFERDSYFEPSGDFNYEEAVCETEEVQRIIKDMETKGYYLDEVVIV